MPDDAVQDTLSAYADRLERDATFAPVQEIRRRAGRRRRRQAAGSAFAVVLVAALGTGIAVGRGTDRDHPLNPATTPGVSPTPATTVTSRPGPRPTGTVSSDVSRLRPDVDLQTGVLLDIADDGVDRWLQYRSDGTVDFTGTAKDTTTEMVLYPAPTAVPNQVQIVPTALGNQCVAATPTPPLTLEPCAVDDKAQIWTVIPAGDSGQFELEGKYGIVHVAAGLIAGDDNGRTGMQTIRF